MNIIILLLTLLLNPLNKVEVNESAVIQTSVDVLEQNHFYDENGKYVFTQFIFYDWDDDICHFQVIAWRLANGKRWILNKDTKVLHFVDGERFRKIRFKSFSQTWTQEDPELLERKNHPREERKELGQ